MKVVLAEMTRERMHELYREFSFDPDIFEQSLQGKKYIYCQEKVDALFEIRSEERNSLAFAVMAGKRVIGEVGLRKIDAENRTCELSIHLQNDGVKNKGYGTEAELLAVEYAFAQLKMESIWAEALEKNTRSQHVLEKIGFQYQSVKNGYRKYRLERKVWKQKW